MEYNQNFLPIDDCDLGFQFTNELHNSNSSSDEPKLIKLKCFTFIKHLLKELIKRMPYHLKVF